MFPWTSITDVPKAGRKARTLRPRTVEETTKELADLRRSSAAETNFDGVLLSSEDRLTKGHITRTLAEISTPEGMLELHRVWREVDSLMGPGKSVLQTLTARYFELRTATTTMSGYLKQLERTTGASARRLVLHEMDRELTKFARLKNDIIKSAHADARALAKELKAELRGDELAKLGKLSVDDVRKETTAALDEFQQALTNMRKAAERGVDARPGPVALRKLAEDQVVALKAGGGTGARKVLSSRIKSLAEFGDPMELGPILAKQMKKRLGRRLSALNDIPDTSLMFMEALGAVCQAKLGGTVLLRRFAEGGASTLNAQELKRVNGYISQVAGLLPEEMAARMKFLEGIFYKRAFETLDQFPPSLRGKLRVEMVEGPLWVVGSSGPPRQFGDGCMLVSGPRGQSTLVGLGEFKAGFDEDLLTQLFVRSDGRAVNSRVRFIDAEGNVQLRTLTRELTFGQGERVALTQPPIYVYGRPAGETPETAAKFSQMVDEQMRSGREMWKIQLPFSAEANRYFAEEAVRESVRILTRARPRWGR